MSPLSTDMPQNPTEPTESAAKPLNRWSIGTVSTIQVVLLALTLIAVNYLAARHYTRADLSRGADYSLSTATARYLTSPAIANRESQVKWVMAYRRSTPFYDRVRVIAEEYARLSNGKIELEVVDAMRSPDRAQQVMASYDLSLAKDLILIDARADDKPAVATNDLGTKELNPHVKLVLAEDMIVYATDPQGQRRPNGFQGEDTLTASLVRAIEGRPRKMLLLADKSRIQAQGESNTWQTLETTLRFQNTELKGVNLSGMTDFPADTEGVALVAPKYDLTNEELAVLERYWNRPRAALLVLLEPGNTLPKLRSFLRANGVTPRNDRIIARENDRIVTAARGTFTYGIDFIKDLAGQTSVFEGPSTSLEVRENADDLLTRKIYPWALFQVADGFWGESQFGDGKEAFDKTTDHEAPLFLAASVTRGDPTDEKLADQVSRMVVMSNTGFLQPDNRRAENVDFLASSVNWLMRREALAGIGPRSLGTYKLPILEAQVSFINRVNWFFLPAFFLATGIFVWSSRRA